jgi:uncharacterized protein YegL
MPTLPLILRRDRLKASFKLVRARLPTIAVVYATSAGQIEVYDDGKPQTWRSQLLKEFAWRYEVDISVHHRTAQVQSTPLPAAGDMYFFETTVTVDFQVTRPDEVIRRNVQDALAVVYGYVLDVSHRITRQHQIEDAQGAEARLDREFAREHHLPQGITILSCGVRLSPDSDARAYLRQIEYARRDDLIGSARHIPNVNVLDRAGHLAAIEQEQRHLLEARELAAMGNTSLDARGLIRLHLLRNPADTTTAIELLAGAEQAELERRDKNDKRWLDLFQFMTQNDLIQPVDVERFRNEGLGRLQNAPGTNFVASAPAVTSGVRGHIPPQVPALAPGHGAAFTPPVDYDAPLAGPPRTTVGPDVIDLVQTSTGVWEPSLGLHPIYLVMDESAAVGPYADQITAGIGQIVSALGNYPEIAKALRLSVLGYSHDAAIRMDMAMVQSGTTGLWVPGQGPARYSAAFRALLEHIPRDVEALKSEYQRIVRPMVFFFSGAQPEDSTEWSTPYRELVDRRVHPYGPNIVATGTGNASQDMIANIATQPNMAFFADTDTDTATAIRHYYAYLQQMLFDYGNAILQGHSGVTIAPPPGFRLISDTV